MGCSGANGGKLLTPISVTVIATAPQPKTLRTYKNRSTFAAAGSAGLTFSPVTQPAHGELVQNGSTWYYEPEPEYVGEDSYSYNGSGPDPITVLVTVEPTCELPVVTTASDGRTVMTSRFGSSVGTAMHSWPCIETKFDCDADPQRCHVEITATSDYAGVADLWIKLPEKRAQSTTYNATSWYRPSTGQAFHRLQQLQQHGYRHPSRPRARGRTSSSRRRISCWTATRPATR